MLNITQFYGEKDQCFKLDLGGIRALQSKLNNNGFGVIMKRVATQEWTVDDIYEVIRFGLVGGGMALQDADTLLKNYFELHSLQYNQTLAAEIVTKVFFEGEKDPVGKPQKTKAEIT